MFKSLVCFTLVSITAIAFCLARPANADPPNPSTMLAQTIIAKAGIHATVCEMPRVGDGTLATALALQGIAQVHALASDNTIAASARVPAAVAGVMGSQVIIETGTPSALPLGAWVADLYVVADATDDNLKSLAASEAGRVLSPYRGVAVVGNPTGGKGGLTQAALTAWATDTGGVATITEDAGGLWAVIKMPPLKGGDDWSHYFHGADGNPVSNDTTVTAGRFNMQWHAKPIWAGKFDTYVAAGGRLFSAHGAIYWRSWTGIVPYELETRDIYNGQILWRRPIARTFGNIGSMLVATPDRLYLSDDNGVLVLDAETGAVIRRMVVTDPAKQCRWLVLADGVLLTVLGPKQAIIGAADNGQMTQDREQDNEIQNNYCQEIVAWNAADGTELWRLREERIDPAKLVISGQHVYFYANLAYAACLDVHSGKMLWKTADPIAEPKNPGLALWWHLNDVYTPRQGAIATKDAYFIDSVVHRQCQAFAAGDGTMLWSRMNGKPSDDPKITSTKLNYITFPLVLDTTIVSHTAGTPAIDLLTGKPINAPQAVGNFSYGGCGHFVADSNGLLLGQLGNVFDSQHNRYLLNEYSKAACGVSQFISDGVVIKVPADCGGCGEWRGYFGVSSQRAGSVAPPCARFEAGHARAANTSKLTAKDWPTYRAAEDRRASSAAVLPAHAAIRWTYTPPRADSYNARSAEYLAIDLEAAPPVTVGNRIWLGTVEGAVVCFDCATGKERWRYWTAGRIMSAPCWSAGRVYVGSCDGWLYCLDADTGMLAWRFRVAPEERRIVITGSLSSAWPVLASPLVHDGVVYAVAGYVAQLDGSCLCALDAQTGAVRWEQQFDTHTDPATLPGATPTAPTAGGQLAWALGRLWWKAGDWGVAAIDPATGNIVSSAAAGDTGSGHVDTASGKVVPTAAGSRGQEIGILPGGWVVSGGRQFILPAEELAQQNSVCSFLQTDARGLPTPKSVVLSKSHVIDGLPAWDDAELLLCGAPGNNLTLARDFPTALTAVVDAPSFHRSTNKPSTDIPLMLPADAQRQVLPPEVAPMHAQRVFGAILAKNAVVCLTAYNPGQNYRASWQLYAVSRSERKFLWVVALPARPVINGLALTAGGDVLVPLLDGRVVCVGESEP